MDIENQNTKTDDRAISNVRSLDWDWVKNNIMNKNKIYIQAEGGRVVLGED